MQWGRAREVLKKVIYELERRNHYTVLRVLKTPEKNISGDHNGEATPVPIPNTEVKLSGAEDTWLETARENMSLPDLYHGSEFIAQSFVLLRKYFRATARRSARLPVPYRLVLCIQHPL